jgi:hypothetical protein
LRREKSIHSACAQQLLCEDLLLNRTHLTIELLRLFVALIEQRFEVPFEAQVSAVEHSRIDVGEDRFQIILVKHVGAQVRRQRNRLS